MSDPELASLDGGDEVAALRAEVKSMRTQFLAGVAALIVLSGSLNFLLLWQVITVGKELDAQRPGVTQMLNDYERVSKPMITRFVADLQEYAKTHPGFQEVLSKYIRSTAPASPGGGEGLTAPQAK